MPWETGSALPDDYVLEITSAIFTKDQQYNHGQTLVLEWKGTMDGAEEHGLYISCGAGWESVDGGQTAVHEKGKDKFDKSSAYGRIINRCIGTKAEGGLDMMGVLQRRGDPMQAATWVGLRFRMKREKLDFGSGLESREREMPVEFLGEAGTVTQVAAAPPAAVPAAPTPTPTLTGAPAPPSNGAAVAAVSGIVEAKVKAAAKQAPDHSAFVDAALAIAGVGDNEELLARIIDPGGIYAEAH